MVAMTSEPCHAALGLENGEPDSSLCFTVSLICAIMLLFTIKNPFLGFWALLVAAPFFIWISGP